MKRGFLIFVALICVLHAKSDMELAEEAFDKDDYKTAVKYFLKGCEAGNGERCYAIGSFYNKGQGVK
jgi:TPR repeat protein